MAALHEAEFYELPDGRHLCTLCPRDCHISEGGRGACAVRCNLRGKLHALAYDRVAARTISPVETRRSRDHHDRAECLYVIRRGTKEMEMPKVQER
jgi:pyruvate formate lyase activating enzyme